MASALSGGCIQWSSIVECAIDHWVTRHANLRKSDARQWDSLPMTRTGRGNGPKRFVTLPTLAPQIQSSLGGIFHKMTQQLQRVKQGPLFGVNLRTSQGAYGHKCDVEHLNVRTHTHTHTHHKFKVVNYYHPGRNLWRPKPGVFGGGGPSGRAREELPSFYLHSPPYSIGSLACLPPPFWARR